MSSSSYEINSIDMKIIDVNLIGTIYGTKMAMQKMSTETGGYGGVVVQLGSMASFVTTTASPLYLASKHAIVGLVRSYDQEFYLRLIKKSNQL